MVSLLLEHGAEVSAKKINGETPLHSAARCGHEAVMKVLLLSLSLARSLSLSLSLARSRALSLSLSHTHSLALLPS